MPLWLMLSLGLLVMAGLSGALYHYHREARLRARSLLPPLVGVTDSTRRMREPISVIGSVAKSEVIWPQPDTPAEAAPSLATAESEARQIMEAATNAARVLVEQAEASRARAAEELAAARAQAAEELGAATAARAEAEKALAAVRAKVAEDLATNKGRLDTVRRQCIEELATIETRKRTLTAECEQVQAAYDQLKADLTLLEENAKVSLSEAIDPTAPAVSPRGARSRRSAGRRNAT